MGTDVLSLGWSVQKFWYQRGNPMLELLSSE